MTQLPKREPATVEFPAVPAAPHAPAQLTRVQLTRVQLTRVQRNRLQARTTGRRRIVAVTAFSAAGAAGLAVAFGGIFAQAAEPDPAPVNSSATLPGPAEYPAGHAGHVLPAPADTPAPAAPTTAPTTEAPAPVVADPVEEAAPTLAPPTDPPQDDDSDDVPQGSTGAS